MKAASSALIALTTLACLTALAISVYPGVLNDLLFLAFLLSFVIVPIVGLIAVVGLIGLAWKRKLHWFRMPASRAAVVLTLVLVMLVCTFTLLTFYVPRRIAFALSRSSFEQMIPRIAPSEHPRTPLNRRLGIYQVDEYAADLRGGVYFRVYSGADGIGPDVMSYGFAYKPNPKGTPFGAARYALFELSHDWYWFCASDDWY